MVQFSSDKILQDVVDSGVLGRSKRQYDLFKYLLEMSWSDKADSVKAYTIAVDLFDRPADFDDSIDSIVRVEMHRLRKNLKSFNRKGSYRLEIPRASYEVRLISEPAPFEASNITSQPPQEIKSLSSQAQQQAAIGQIPETNPQSKVRSPYILPVLAGLVLLAVIAVSVLSTLSRSSKIDEMQCKNTMPITYVMHKPEKEQGLPTQLTSYILDLFSSSNSSYSVVEIVTNQDCAEYFDYILSFTELRNHELEYELSFILRDVSTKNVIWSDSLFVPKNYTTEGIKDQLSGMLYILMDPRGIVPEHSIQNNDWGPKALIEDYICSQQAKSFINTEIFEAHDMLLQCMNEAIENGTASADLYGTYITLLQYERKKYLPQKTWNREDKIKEAILKTNLLNPSDVQFTLSIYREYRDSDNVSKNELHGIIDNSRATHRFNPYMRAQTARMNALYLGNWEEGKREIENARKILQHPDYFIFFSLAYSIVNEQYQVGLEMVNKHHPFINPIYEIHAAVIAHSADDAHLLKKSVISLRESGFHSIAEVKKAVLDSKYDKIFERKLIEGLDEISERPDMQGYWPRPEPL